eukprot:CAMPEP_0185560440 /NCGR_PEP_ID=MMETSP1381-20130426/56918_1 /TAXON_ID=298111 /ORGANISM="Pavlova sp., Strain CCMP459" /LENGTH=36 /DNA_ID= /DNA_START= /DNA_END= /DNA_ORIENTATION=
MLPCAAAAEVAHCPAAPAEDEVAHTTLRPAAAEVAC